MLREPLLQFFLIGAAIFVVYGLIGDRSNVADTEVVVTAGQVQRMADAWEKTRMRPPTKQELEGLVENYVQEEIYYREAVAMGLDVNNPVVRRAMRQKMDFLAETYQVTDPTEQDLQQYLDDNAEKFADDTRFSFRHLYFNVDKRGQEAYDAAESALEKLREGESVAGDLFLLDNTYNEITSFELARLFGAEFEQQLLNVETGSWQGPIRSGYGLHLIFLTARTTPQKPELADVRSSVEEEWRNDQRKRSAEAFYKQLRENYSVTVEDALPQPDSESPVE